MVKGKGGVIGLTENPAALQRWLLCGPELSRCISEFESDIKTENSSLLGSKEVVHHEENVASQKNFQQQVNSLISTIDEFGNPFQDDCSELLVLDIRACADTSSLSDFGKIRIGRKSLLLSCLETADNQTIHPNQFDCKILDGVAVVHFLKSNTAITFADYSDKIFILFILQQLQDVNRIDIVWDRYFSKSIKGGARDKRGNGIRIKVSAQAKIPKKWEEFLRDSSNKEELFSFLTNTLSRVAMPEGKSIFVTAG